MKSAFLGLISLSILMIAGTVHAGTVYQWTDENGVRHFSNTGAPDNINEVDTTAEKRTAPDVENEAEREAIKEQEEIISNAPNPSTSPGVQPSAPPAPPTRPQTSTPTPRERMEEAQEERASRRVEDERRRLEAEIAQVEQRGLSVTFTEGMRSAILTPLNEQLSLLNANPSEYFRQKQSGAFNRGGRTSSNRDRRGGRTGEMRENMQ